MMKTANIVSENLREAETGLQWEEQLSGTTGTLELDKAQTYRVRSVGATTVTVDGVLAMTMMAGEIAVFNVGVGNQINTNVRYSTIVIAGAGAYVQVARDTTPLRTTLNPFNELLQPQANGETP
jgi:hypothetical protein